MVLDSANQFSSMGKSLQDLFSGIIQIGFQSKENPNKTEKTVDSLQSQQLDINSKVFKTSSLKVTKLDFNSQKKRSCN